MSQGSDSGEDLPLTVVSGRAGRTFGLTSDDRDFLVAMATRLCRSNCDPNDLVQDVLERAIKHSDSIPADDPRPWLVRVMRNLFIDRVRKVARTPRHDAIDDRVVAMPVPVTMTWWQQLEPADIRARLAELPDELRVTFELFAFDSLSYEQIATRLEISKNTVGTRVLRARRRLRALFEGGRDE
jgi:RNA polymerase sigma-70 factor, ECF subfamily